MKPQNSQPLWLPRGSVRAILSLLIVAPIVALSLKSGINLTGDQVVGLASLVIGAYFVQKSGSSDSA